MVMEERVRRQRPMISYHEVTSCRKTHADEIENDEKLKRQKIGFLEEPELNCPIDFLNEGAKLTRTPGSGDPTIEQWDADHLMTGLNEHGLDCAIVFTEKDAELTEPRANSETTTAQRHLNVWASCEEVQI